MDIASEIAKAYSEFAAGRHAEAAECAQRVLEASPQDPAALTLIGRLALAAGEPETAHDIALHILDRHPQKAALWLDLALALRELGRHQEAANAALQAASIDQRDPAARIRLGEIWLSLNERQQAGNAFRQAFALAPTSVAACKGICQVSNPTPGSEIVRHMEALIASSGLRPAETAGLHYALAQVYRREGPRQEFIRHLFAANAIQRANCGHGREEYAAIFDRLESAFTKEAFAAARRADPTEPSPIFIMGMPRSGTTLMEQIVAEHPAVAAGGELDYMRRSLRRAVERLTGLPFPSGFETIPAADMNSMASAFAKRLSLTGRGSRHVTDKTPGNFHVLGLLRVLFPVGRIIHVTRDAMDTCFSVLQYQFDDQSPHTCDVELLAYAFARYLRMMSRWLEIFGNEFVSVEYERLVESPIVESRRIFGFCGLEWNDSYLEFHRARTPVRTFSATQVRQPIYRTSVGAWREFADELAPLRRALQRELQNGGALD